ncbi:hypothetical protein CEXT_557671 [Caerostris extrusa]|uniref:Uncharacterized protein n=1 Tax=Caerostris extrusa TaxID=172846 RepID=A0AAV4UXI0_CAEEX|nr:hypothetical protein CEXT_557671 [Caerostris extrusa]
MQCRAVALGDGGRRLADHPTHGNASIRGDQKGAVQRGANKLDPPPSQQLKSNGALLGHKWTSTLTIQKDIFEAFST